MKFHAFIAVAVAMSLIGCGKGKIPDVSDIYKTTPVSLRINFASDVASAKIYVAGLSTLEQEKLENLYHGKNIIITITGRYDTIDPSYVDTSGREWEGGNMYLRPHHTVVNFGPSGNISFE